ncbi:YdiU family protein [Dechloromonas sp. XY25]|uniref:Protein nucleotidyltransferase YdiU n=1 Tax=Dechloromonas hankyongensis TaxID=2908002 RepID=A0ABS9JXT1_9RHOO|nr:YdiU family protein [Dechloromonas hankyongensis]MCG2575706.1 YdiU family protein [Dechloromonas hankyongensis]
MNAPESPLPELPVFDNSFAALPGAFYTRLAPHPLPEPYVVAVSNDVAALLGLPAELLDSPQFAEIFVGNRLLPGSDPLAAVYSGHQFGVWAGQLGDGRAHLLGGLRNELGHWEIQLKGAGRTPYSRGADGRAVLRSSIREFLCSEAMAGLGIPTTRALCVIGADHPVYREEVETAAVVTRVAQGFVRFGSFEHWSSRDRDVELRQLADYVIDTFRPECRTAANPYDALLRDVSRRTGELIAQWMAVGFMHGVMNTDNMSILGLTLDYGPFGFMEAFDAGHICNHSDHRGRYTYRNQPHVAQWNLYCLADALHSLVGGALPARQAIDETFGDAFEASFERLMRAKLGLRDGQPDDETFIGETFGFLQQHRPDFTLFFRTLSGLSGTANANDAALRDMFVDRAACDAWLENWRARLARTPWDDAERQAAMRAANPKYVLRNWLAEVAIRKARSGDYTEVQRLLACLRQPYDEQPEYAAYAALPPDWANGLEVSCSS